MGRGRALEVLLGAEDINGDLAERYGSSIDPCLTSDWTDSSMLSPCVSRLSTRRQLPIPSGSSTSRACRPDPEIAAGWNTFVDSVQHPPAQAKIKQLMTLSLQTNSDVETRLGHYTGTLGDR